MPGVLEEEQEGQGVCSGIKKGNIIGEESGSKGAKLCGTVALTPSKPLAGCDRICSMWIGVAAGLRLDYRGQSRSRVASEPGRSRPGSNNWRVWTPALFSR